MREWESEKLTQVSVCKITSHHLTMTHVLVRAHAFEMKKKAQRENDKIKWTRTEMWCQTQNIVYSNSILCSRKETFCVTITSFGFIFSLSLSLRWLASCKERAVDYKIFEPNNHAKNAKHQQFYNSNDDERNEQKTIENSKKFMWIDIN